MTIQILIGDNQETLKTLADNSIEAVVTDPPYGIDFLGKAWDANTGALETYKECLRVLKPGGYILAFSAARTYHHLAVTLEQAGFEMWADESWKPEGAIIDWSSDYNKELEKFAELIVRECADWIDSNVGMVDEEARQDLLKHFGVE